MSAVRAGWDGALEWAARYIEGSYPEDSDPPSPAALAMTLRAKKGDSDFVLVGVATSMQVFEAAQRRRTPNAEVSAHPQPASTEPRRPDMAAIARDYHNTPTYVPALVQYAEALEAERDEMRGALSQIGIFRDEEVKGEWCVTLEPRGEDPAGTLLEALRRTMRASENDGRLDAARCVVCGDPLPTYCRSHRASAPEGTP